MFRSCLGIIFVLKRRTFRCIFSSKGRYLTSKIKFFCQKLALWEGHFDHFGAQKSRFLDFLKVVLEMFRSCLGIIFGLKRPNFRCIFSSKGRYMTSKIKISCQNLGLWEGHFGHFGVQKSRFLDFLKVVLELFRSGLGIIFGLKMPTFSCIFSSKGRYMTSKIKILGQKLALWEGHFDHFGVQKSRFLDFLKVVLEMFRRCLGIVFGLKSLTFSCIFSPKGRYMISKLKILCQNLALWEGHFDHFQGQKKSFLVFWKLF